MAKIDGPWGSSEDRNPWGGTPENNTAKPKGEPNYPIKFELKIKWIILALFVFWILSGFYQVQTNEQGVVLRFGRYTTTTEAGLHYCLPFPIERVEKVNITQERSINLGVGSEFSSRKYASNTSNSVEYNTFTDSHMLTGDENIVDINLTVVWIIKDAKDYLFNIKSPDQTVVVAAQSVLREIVGQSEMQSIITGDRGKVEDDTKEELQKLLDEFKSGIHIVRVKLQKADPPKQVVDAFNEVQRAKADMERFKNEAEAYRNEVIPQAKGEAEKVLQSAEAYKSAVINRAEGDAERFTSVYRAYIQGREVTSKRLYIEAMENVLANSKKTIVEKNGVLPLLQLKQGGKTNE